VSFKSNVIGSAIAASVYARIDDFEIPGKFIRHVLPFVGGVRVVGKVSGENDCSMIKQRLSLFKIGAVVSLDAISTNGERLYGPHGISEIKVEEKRILLDRPEITFHVVLKPQ
jgi:hypothetical protein